MDDTKIGLRQTTFYFSTMTRFLKIFTTSTVGKVLPQFIEDYGEGKKLDLHFSPSHRLFVEQLPGSKMTGVYIDKNGNWKFQFNIVMNLNVERGGGQWSSARDIYMTVVFKMKMKQDDTNPFNKVISVTPRSLEISQLKVLKGDEEMTVEQTMLQSMANLQMETLKKAFKEYPLKIGDILSKNPKELACLGFNVSDVDVSFAKGFAQLSAYYKEVKNPPSKEVCNRFLDDLKDAPNKIQQKVAEVSDSPVFKDLKEKTAKDMAKDLPTKDFGAAVKDEL